MYQCLDTNSNALPIAGRVDALRTSLRPSWWACPDCHLPLQCVAALCRRLLSNCFGCGVQMIVLSAD
jgi:hypothetical protein